MRAPGEKYEAKSNDSGRTPTTVHDRLFRSSDCPTIPESEANRRSQKSCVD
jgi:hypothetical protein